MNERERIRRRMFHKPKGVPQEPPQRNNIEVSPELAKLFPPKKIERIKAKALRRYKWRQDIQWENYLESMSK